MGEWREVEFEDVLVDRSISYGIVQPGSHIEENSIPIIRVQNIRKGRIATDDVKKVAIEIEAKHQKTRLKGGELLITVVGSVGETAFVPDELKGWNVARAVSVANIIDGVDKRFVRYAFATEDMQFQMYGNTNDTVQPTLNLKELKTLTLLLPSLSEQKAIAEVLSSLDDKIDLLHKQNQTLEALAETLFRHTIIDNAQDDWVEGTLDDLIEFNPKLSLKKGISAPYLEMGNVATNSSLPLNWHFRDFNSGMRFQNNDTLLARITPCLENGKTSFVQFLKGEQIGWGSTEFIVMRMRDGFNPFVSYLWARDEDFREFAISVMSGSSGRQRVKADDLRGYKIYVPPKHAVTQLNSLCDEVVPKLAHNFDQVCSLTNLRDTLLPKLMSGDIRVDY